MNTSYYLSQVRDSIVHLSQSFDGSSSWSASTDGTSLTSACGIWGKKIGPCEVRKGPVAGIFQKRTEDPKIQVETPRHWPMTTQPTHWLLRGLPAPSPSVKGQSILTFVCLWTSLETSLPGSTKEYPQEIFWWFSIQRHESIQSNHIISHIQSRLKIYANGSVVHTIDTPWPGESECPYGILWLELVQLFGQLEGSLNLSVCVFLHIIEAPWSSLAFFWCQRNKVEAAIIWSLKWKPGGPNGWPQWLSSLLFNGRGAGSIQDPGLSIHLKILSWRWMATPGCRQLTN